MTTPMPASAAADGRNRALRTFVQGLFLDVVVAASTALTVAVTDVQWTRAYAVAAGGLVAKSALLAGVSYLSRQLVPPAR